MLRFIGGMGMSGRITSDTYDIRVQITHVLSEGYLPSADGQTIKEEMPLREFLERIFETGRDLENELYRVSKCLAGGHYYNNDEISRISHKYDAMYSEKIRKGKLILAQHKMSQNMMMRGIGGLTGVDPYDGQQRAQLMAQKSAMDYHREHQLREIGMVHAPSRGILDNGPTQKELLEQKEKEIAKKP